MCSQLTAQRFPGTASGSFKLGVLVLYYIIMSQLSLFISSLLSLA